MDGRVIGQKLENLKNCTLRLQHKCPSSADILASDFDVQDIISVNLERAIQSCIDIAAHLATEFDDIAGMSAANLFTELITKGVLSQYTGERMIRAVGFRNLLVHRYASIDWARVFGSLSEDVALLRAFAGEVSVFCKL